MQTVTLSINSRSEPVSLRRWTLWSRLVLLLPLCGLPACTSLTGQPREHVYSAKAPCELVTESERAPVVRAHYPEPRSGQSGAVGARYEGPPLPPGLMPLSQNEAAPPASAGPLSAAGTPTATGSPDAIRLASWSLPAEWQDGAEPAGHVSMKSFGRPAGSGLVRSFTPAEARLPVRECPTTPGAGLQPMTPAELYPDEYLCDGGDRNWSVHYTGGNREGLDTEDTVAEYTDLQGRSHIRPSNRVCVYSPRFGSVRSISGVTADIQVDQVFRARDVSGTGQLDRRLLIAESRRGSGPLDVDSRSRADGVEHRRFLEQQEQQGRAAMHDLAAKARMDQQTTGLDILRTNRSPELNARISAALAWSRDRFPQLLASTEAVQQIKAEFTAEAMIGIEDKRGRKSEVQIIKTADRDVAVPGEEITFTLRYVNTGDYPLRDIRIIDNLTPRLAYVIDSATTDRAGDVTAEPNGEGSQVLTFTLDEPLPAREQGTITFRARVQ